MATPIWPDVRGRFGPYGGRYVPETLVTPLEELERAYGEACADEQFHKQLDYLLRTFAGRPTPLQFAERLTAHLSAARAFISSAKTCFIPAPTRSITAWGRRCSPCAWGSGA